ncbi:MAG: PD-(D/E)XK nuclease family protein [Euryarchaeota archaeon]|nr:PD-(D/E)XK nuclease family protein [Euryarchaeota archaeon]
MVDVVYAALFLGLVGVAAWALYRLFNPPVLTPARALAVDQPSLGGGMRTLSSPRYRLSGRPDELRRSRDGRLVPVEIKSTRAPRSGVPYPSHRIQLLAYCLLLEEATGAPPPFGVLSFGDGTEIPVRWDDEARAEVLGVLEEWRQPYRGAMDPAPGKCRTCAFGAVCAGARSAGLS